MEEIIVFLLLVISPVFYLRAIKGMPYEKIKTELFGKFQGFKKEILGSIGLFLSLFIGFIIIVSIINLLGINDLALVESALNEAIAFSPIYFLITIIFLVFAEELFFRVFLIKRLGVIISTIIFTILHIGYGSVAELIGVFFLGLILAVWYDKFGSLIQNYSGHLLYNLLAISLIILI